MDYFSAALGITYSLFLAVVRIWHMYPTAAEPNFSTAFKRLAALTAMIYTCHVVYLSSLERFDCPCRVRPVLSEPRLTSLLPLRSPTDAYNILYNATIGISHNLLWMLWSLTSSIAPTRLVAKVLPAPYPAPATHLPHAQPRSQTQTRLPALVGVLFMLAMCFELFDFAPLYRTFDAHSLWHLATVFVVPLWWRFLVADAACFDGGSGPDRP
jgi:hypothetical protein